MEHNPLLANRSDGLRDRLNSAAAGPHTAAPTLTIADTAEMVALAELTKPGPFGKRTRELGHYVGIRESNRLVAMAGEKMHLQGYTEVSAVCTHPEFQGRGYAGRLMSILVREIVPARRNPYLARPPGKRQAPFTSTKSWAFARDA